MWSVVAIALAQEPPLPEEQACEQGAAPACTVLGHAYLTGEGVPVDRFLAVQLFRKGCAGEDAPACMWLAEAYRTGEGLKRDEVQAVDLYDHACRLGNAVACRSVGDLYTMGAVGPADGGSAGRWYLEGCALGDPQSCTAAALCVERGEGGVLHVSDTARSLALFEQGCRGGHRRGCTMLGDRFLKGSDGADKDVDAAYAWYRLGCEAPYDPEACRVLGEAQVRGSPIGKEPDAGLENLEHACYLADVRACHALGPALASRDRLPEALMAAQRGCDLGDRASCLLAARVTTRLSRTLTP